MKIKKIISIVRKHKLYFPWRFVRFCYYNYHVVNRKCGRFLLFSSQCIFDLHNSATINLFQEVEFGWCNMKRTSLETALCMGKNSKIQFGGG